MDLDTKGLNVMHYTSSDMIFNVTLKQIQIKTETDTRYSADI